MDFDKLTTIIVSVDGGTSRDGPEQPISNSLR